MAWTISVIKWTGTDEVVGCSVSPLSRSTEVFSRVEAVGRESWIRQSVQSSDPLQPDARDVETLHPGPGRTPKPATDCHKVQKGPKNRPFDTRKTATRTRKTAIRTRKTATRTRKTATRTRKTATRIRFRGPTRSWIPPPPRGVTASVQSSQSMSFDARGNAGRAGARAGGPESPSLTDRRLTPFARLPEFEENATAVADCRSTTEPDRARRRWSRPVGNAHPPFLVARTFSRSAREADWRCRPGGSAGRRATRTGWCRG